MKQNKTNRTDLLSIVSLILVFITFWIQIVFGLLGRMDFLTGVNLIVYTISAWYFFYNAMGKENPERKRKPVFSTSIMLTILVIIYLIVYYTTMWIRYLGTGL